ncbi:MATE family efflux transporter [Phragmitibacter flavus]|uniref:Multidrug-efflux transporter n=1 Tax=Phragmitibacter flavus TaxID=2576071 RepID=A0A5R8KJF5_9BACT|nr:MATE family efflux transporter [Phragmitibacter flavus]TLD72453.1 MATE family efflux transporter [Phragmitibacter flavus]
MSSSPSPAPEPPPSPDPIPVTPAPSFWKNVGQALRGHEIVLTSVNTERAVLLLAVPMILEMVMESLFAIVDVFFVSRLGKDPVAVIGITESMMTIIYAVAIGISIAAGAIVSRRIGEKDPERASHAAGQILILGMLVASGSGLVTGYFTPQLLALMGADDNVIRIGTEYARIMLGGNATVFLIFLINAVFRGAGDAVIAMRTLWIANGINIVLDPCLIFGLGPFPEMGVTGAAVATNIGRGIGVAYQIWHLIGHQSRLRVRLTHLKPDVPLLISIMRTASNGIAQLLISTTSWVGLFKILAMFGSSALAGYTVAMRIIIFALMPAWGLANAGATLVGQNLGANQPDQAEKAVRIATKYNVIVLSFAGLLFIIFSTFLASLFTTDPEVKAYAVQALWIVSLGFPLYAAGMCLEGAFNGAGDTWTPTRLNFFCFWVGQIPLAWFLSKVLNWGSLGVFIAVPTAFGTLAIWSWFVFRMGKWKLKQI